MEIGNFNNILTENGFKFFVGTQNHLFKACSNALSGDFEYLLTFDFNQAITACKASVFANNKTVCFASKTEFKNLISCKNLFTNDNLMYIIVDNENYQDLDFYDDVDAYNVCYINNDREISDFSKFKIFEEGQNVQFEEIVWEDDGIIEEIVEFVCQTMTDHKVFSSVQQIDSFSNGNTNIQSCANNSALLLAYSDYLNCDDRKIRVVFDDRKNMFNDLNAVSLIGSKNPQNTIYFVFNKKENIINGHEDIELSHLLPGLGFGVIIALSIQDVKNITNQILEEFTNEDNNLFAVIINY